MEGAAIAKARKSSRIGEVEFWRFIFSIVIVFHHSRLLVGDDNALFFNGAYAVEFFFILSGYLLMHSVERAGESTLGLGRETIQFIWKKYKSFCPEIFVSWIIGAVATILITGKSLRGAIDLFLSGVWEMTLTHMGGLYIGKMNRAVWYLSSMLLCMVILYPLLRKYKETAKKLIVPLISLLLFSWLYKDFGTLRVPFNWTGLTFNANLRALADLGLGVICYQFTQKLMTVRLTLFARILATLVKWGSYGVTILYMYVSKRANDTYDFFFLLLFMIAIGLTFSRQGIDSRLFDNRLVLFLGRFSLPLYLSHLYWGELLAYILPKTMGLTEQVAIYWAMGIVTALAVMGISAGLRKHKTFFVNLGKKLFLKTPEIAA